MVRIQNFNKSKNVKNLESYLYILCYLCMFMRYHTLTEHHKLHQKYNVVTFQNVLLYIRLDQANAFLPSGRDRLCAQI